MGNVLEEMLKERRAKGGVTIDDLIVVEEEALKESENLCAKLAERDATIAELELELVKSKRATVYYADAQQNLSDELCKRVALDLQDDHWRWMGDGGDHLESMAEEMVIVIRACDMRRATQDQVHKALKSEPAASEEERHDGN